MESISWSKMTTWWEAFDRTVAFSGIVSFTEFLRASLTSVAVILVIVGLSGSRALHYAMVVQVYMGELCITVFKRHCDETSRLERCAPHFGKAVFKTIGQVDAGTMRLASDRV
ncbi:MAG: hypothetical protein ACREEE_06625, partial [Dongiaceae bacterium]